VATGHPVEETASDQYEKAKFDRSQIVDAIISSTSAKKVVVAGPGTGKTFLFKQALKGKSNTLTLTFVNALVEDLSLELFGLSTVKTLHGYARSVLTEMLKKEIKIHILVSKIIRADAEIIHGKDIDFNRIFHERDDGNTDIPFYTNRRDYYGYFGFTDIIYEVVRRFEGDGSLIPKYEQILVDEFQDFNKLEVTLIEALASRSAILIAGDDDQALYEFKHANAEHIRNIHDNSSTGYTAFNLPFCARCPKVLVDAISDFINNSIKKGFLKGRIKKPYSYFVDREKDAVSAQYSTIGHLTCHDGQIPWAIQNIIRKTAEELKSSFSVLIISPFSQKLNEIVPALREKGLKNIDFTQRLSDDSMVLLDAFNLLCEDMNDALAWRIILPFLMNVDDFKKVLIETEKDPSVPLLKLVPGEIIKDVKAIVKSVKQIMKGDRPSDVELQSVFKRFEIEPFSTAISFLIQQIELINQNSGEPALRKIPIKATTIQSSKGLAADVVIITHFDDRYYLDRTGITDRNICNFLVALTRAKKKVVLISTQTKTPEFLQWIAPDKLHIMDVRKLGR
jgi:hypothetical protein